MSGAGGKVRGYVLPPEPVPTLDNKYYAATFVNPRIPSNCDHSLGEKRDLPTYAPAERGPRFFTKPLVPASDKMWPRNQSLPPIARNDYKEPILSDDILKNYSTFEEWKNSRNFEDYYPGLFEAPHKVYPGRLFGTAFGSFDWWRSQPDFDWWNASNQQRQTWFRHDPTNAKGDSVGPRIPPSREVCRVPPTDGPEFSARRRACSEDRQNQVAVYENKPDKRGYWPLVRKYCPPVPRFPLVKNENDQLLPTFGGFAPMDTMRGQVSKGFCQTGPAPMISARSDASRSTAPGSGRSRSSGRSSGRRG
mmetsp:Transcript_27779/g.70147  ORF Transcript_27779/g.70147 Transcript_27779/m.70147 type:complete len:306 (-) Transcript_27779:622-1539(-)|eukprot:g11232.t1